MTSKERMSAVMECREVDYVPCSFMIFFNLYNRCKTEREFVERQLELGLDAYTHAGRLKHSFHPDVKYSEWVEEKDGGKIFCRRIDTPKGPLTGRVRQTEGWPREGHFPIFNDYITGRAEEILVKPEEDLEKLKYFFGPSRDEDIQALRDSATEAKKVADQHQLLQVGGWKAGAGPGMDGGGIGDSDGGVMGCDCMAWLSGYEEVMTLSLLKPEVIKEYVNIIHNWNMRQIEIYLDVTDADIIMRRAWYETTEFWTPESYKEIIAPTIRKEAELVHQAGRKYGYIITSAFLPLLDHILNADIDVLIGIDPEQGKGTELDIVKEKFLSRKKALWGGVSGAITVELGTEKNTADAVVGALKVLGRGGGFILSPVDNIREDTENAGRNTHVFIDTWKKYR